MGAWGDGVIALGNFGDGGSIFIEQYHKDSGALQQVDCVRIGVSEVDFDHSRPDF